MSIRRVLAAVTLLGAAALLAGCAGPGAGGPGPAKAPPAAVAPAPPRPPMASEREILPFTEKLEAGTPAERPGLLLKRAQAAMKTAQALRWSKMKSWDIIPPEDEKRYVAFYELAQSDLQDILVNSPTAREAAEAQYTVALIWDYPHMTDFTKALAEYHKTVERYPKSDAAARAATRIKHLEEMAGPSSGAPAK